ncbi:MAG: sugar transferase [Sarcina sp.]
MLREDDLREVYEAKHIYRFFKRLFDLVVSLLVVCLFWFVFLGIAIAIKLNSKGPVLFKQKRAGLYNKPFYIYKFRTMKIETPNVATNDLQDASSYITGVGKFLRKTSLDELPQFFNVIKGEISIVGPRPIMLEETELLDLRHKYGADAVLPGITGLAQINGRDFVTVEEKVDYDVTYIRKASFWYDIKIIITTTLKVVVGDGIVA